MTNRHYEIIRGLPVWKDKKIRIAVLQGGMTNYNYIVFEGTKRYVVRFAPENQRSLGLERKREIYNYKVANMLGIGPRIFKHYPKHSALIVEYLEGSPLTKKQAEQPYSIRQIAKMLLKLHNGPRLKGKRSSLKRGYEYIELAQKHGAWLPKDLSWYLEKIKIIQRRLSPLSNVDPCHDDLMFSNIVRTKNGGFKLIDWEYSGSDDYRFDLAMFSVKGSFGKKEDLILAKAYSPNEAHNLYTELQYMKMVVYFVEAAYGLLQNAISKIQDVDYKQYALDNLKGFKKQAKKLLL